MISPNSFLDIDGTLLLYHWLVYFTSSIDKVILMFSIKHSSKSRHLEIAACDIQIDGQLGCAITKIFSLQLKFFSWLFIVINGLIGDCSVLKYGHYIDIIIIYGKNFPVYNQV